jgi:hypothetical protein
MSFSGPAPPRSFCSGSAKPLRVSLFRCCGKGNTHLRLVGGNAHRALSGASVLSDARVQTASVGAAARRAGLEFVEKLLTSAMVALLDGAEREHAARPRPARRITGRAGYRSWLCVDLVAAAVAHRRLDPSSSAATSTTQGSTP